MPKISLKTTNFQPHIYIVGAFRLREEKMQGIYYYYYYYYLKQMKKPNAKKDTKQGIFICEEKKGIRKLSLYRELQRPRVTSNPSSYWVVCMVHTNKCSSKHTSSFLCGNTNEKKHFFLFSVWGGGEGRGVGLAPRGFSHVKGLGCKFS
jgi:hypothetical protein